MRIAGLDHYNIQTALPDETIAFYTNVLGAHNDPRRRPDFGRPGAWLFIADRPLIHLNFVEEDLSGSTGPVNHIAFTAEGFLEHCDRLDELGLDYTTAEQPDIDLLQIFVADPNDVLIELTFVGEQASVKGRRSGLDR